MSMKAPLVILTRPVQQATELASRLVATGRQTQIFPLLEIRGLEDNTELDATLAKLGSYALVAFVSPNAVDAVFRRIQHWPPGLAIAVMGAGSRAALAAHGVTDANAKIISPTNPDRTDSETLLDELDFATLSKQQVLIVRGESGRELLADALRAKAVSVKQVAAYRRMAPEFTLQKQQALAAFLAGENDWVITSSEALGTLMSWVQQLSPEGGVAKMQQQHIVVPHVRIAETAQLLGFRSITLTGSGDEHLLVALQSEL
jgi:uroporphyrinogen-III synthase